MRIDPNKVERLTNYLLTNKIKLEVFEKASEDDLKILAEATNIPIDEIGQYKDKLSLKEYPNPSKSILDAREKLQVEGLIPKQTDEVPQADNDAQAEQASAASQDAQPSPSVEADTDKTPTLPTAENPDEQSGDKKPFWKSWGTIITGVVGVLALLGSLFSSEEGSRGKSLFAAIGGLLVGGSVLAQWPVVSKLFGKPEETKPETEENNSETHKPPVEPAPEPAH